MLSFSSRSYVPWSIEEDEYLEKAIRADVPIDVVAAQVKRTVGAVRSRLKLRFSQAARPARAHKEMQICSFPNVGSTVSNQQ
jgi:hypothetical protein